MRQQSEFRCHPPFNSSAGWGAGSNDKREGNEPPPEPKSAAYGESCWRSSALVLLCLLLAVPVALGSSAKSSSKLSPPLQKMLDTADPATVVDVIAQYEKGLLQPVCS